MSTVQPVQIRVREHSCTQIRRSHLSMYEYRAQCKRLIRRIALQVNTPQKVLTNMHRLNCLYETFNSHSLRTVRQVACEMNYTSQANNNEKSRAQVLEC